MREDDVEIISLRESIDQDNVTGRPMLHLAITYMELDADCSDAGDHY